VSRRLLVLAWHNIDPTPGLPGSTPDRARRIFAAQLRTLRRWTTVVPLRSALADLAAGRPLPPRAVALTFDDGYLDNATVAAPMLADAGLPATFFLVPDFLDGSAPAWWEDLGRVFAQATAAEVRWGGKAFDTSHPAARQEALWRVGELLKEVDGADRRAAVEELRSRLAPEPPVVGERLFMDWHEADRLVELGHDVQSHTCSHPILSRERPAVQEHELVDSRAALAAHFQRPVDVLAYPNGRAVDYDATTLELARGAGYEFAVTTRSARARAGDPRYEVPRLVVTAETDVRELVLKASRTLRRALPRRKG
jgi:peptidoglycan/xylan/chitin deacetylase (PgdA/CDA1 family)